jgi:hypothetical protein
MSAINSMDVMSVDIAGLVLIEMGYWVTSGRDGDNVIFFLRTKPRHGRN